MNRLFAFISFLDFNNLHKRTLTQTLVATIVLTCRDVSMDLHKYMYKYRNSFAIIVGLLALKTVLELFDSWIIFLNIET